MKRQKRWGAALVVGITAIVLGSVFWIRGRTLQPVPVTTVTVTRGAIEAFVKATAFVNSPHEFTVVATESGRVADLRATVGMSLRRGDLVASIDASAVQQKALSAHAALAAAGSEVRQAELDAKAEEAIWKAGGEARQAVDQAQLRLAAARSRRDGAQADLRGAYIAQAEHAVFAPADGVVTAVPGAPGVYVLAGAPLLSLSSRNGLEVRIKIDQGSADLIKVGQPVELTNDVTSAAAIRTHVSAIEPTIQKEGASNYLIARAPLPANRDDVRLNQQFDARIVVASRSNVLRVPLDVMTQVDGHDMVRIIAQERLHLQAVRTGIQDDEQIEVVDGLGLGEQVVFPTARIPLVEGMTVRRVEGAQR